MRIYERWQLKARLLDLYEQSDRLADQLMIVRLRAAKLEERLTEEGEASIITEANRGFLDKETPVKHLDEDGMERSF